MGGRLVRQQDVERILQDVLAAHGWRVSASRVERLSTAWRVVVTDTANRTLSTNLSDGPPAAVRAALTRWASTQN